jgi:hypothetical protein
MTEKIISVVLETHEVALSEDYEYMLLTYKAVGETERRQVTIPFLEGTILTTRLATLVAKKIQRDMDRDRDIP